MWTWEQNVQQERAQLNNMSKQLFLDTETTGLNYKTDTIRQLGYIYRVGGKVVKQADITKNIYATFIKDLDGMVDKYNKKDKIYLIAYNAKFDAEFLRKMFEDNKNLFYGSYFYCPEICVMQMAAFKFMRKDIHPENFKLSTICRHLGVKVNDDKLHDALYDATITKNLYNKLLKV